MTDLDTDRRRALEAELEDDAAEVERIEADLGEARAKRDASILRLRALPDPPSARTVAALGRVTDTWVLKLEKRPT